MLESGCCSVLDIGCGCGDNAALIKDKYPGCKVFGVTISQAEADMAQQHLERCWVFDVEQEMPDDLAAQSFDVLVFSHILEHLRNPSQTLADFTRLLAPGGVVFIAVPNILSWCQRIQFLFGRFEYKAAGVLDDTHLRFFTYFTADQYLLAQSPDLKLQIKGVAGSVPLWWFRRYVFHKAWSEAIDAWGCRHWPNLFGGQVLIKAIKK